MKNCNLQELSISDQINISGGSISPVKLLLANAFFGLGGAALYLGYYNGSH